MAETSEALPSLNPRFVCNIRAFDVELANGPNTLVLPIGWTAPVSFTFVNGVQAITAATLELAVDYAEDNATPLWGPATAFPTLVVAGGTRVHWAVPTERLLAIRLVLTVGGASTISYVGKG